MGIPCYLDPLGSGNSEPYKKGTILARLDNPQALAVQEIDMPAKGVLQLWLVSGGNSYKWCYIGCNVAGSGAGFIGKLYFTTKCHLKLTVGAQRQDSILQAAPWGNKSSWTDLVLATSSKDSSSGDPRPSIGHISVNRSSPFNTVFDVELEANGNGGSSGYGASVWNGYGSGSTNGFGQLQYIRSRP